MTAAAGSERRFRGLDGQSRAALYLAAMGTGFRAQELKTITVEAMSLESDPPTVTVSPAYTKNGQAAEQPITAELASALAAHVRVGLPHRRRRLVGVGPQHLRRVVPPAARPQGVVGLQAQPPAQLHHGVGGRPVGAGEGGAGPGPALDGATDDRPLRQGPARRQEGRPAGAAAGGGLNRAAERLEA